MYNLIISGSVIEDIKDLEGDLRDTVVGRYLPALQKDPHSGIPISGDSMGLHKFSFSHDNTDYRIIYEIVEINRMVIVIIIASYDDFYPPEE